MTTLTNQPLARRTRVSPEESEERMTLILNVVLSAGTPVRVGAIAAATGLNSPCVSRYLSTLKSQGLIRATLIPGTTSRHVWSAPGGEEVRPSFFIPVKTTRRAGSNDSNGGFHGEGMKGLLAAVLNQSREGLFVEDTRRECPEWLVSRNECMFSFTWICDCLGFNREAVLEEITRQARREKNIRLPSQSIAGGEVG